MKWGDSPRAVAEAADLIFVMVTDSRSLEAVSGGADGFLAGLREGKVVVDSSTVNPAVSRDVAEKVRAKGADMVDAPVSGSVSTLEAGKLSVMVGGRRATFDRIKPVLDDIGPKVTHVGDNGLALSMKIAHNLSLAVQMLAFSEGVLLAEKSGIPREVAVDVLTHSVIASPMVQYRGPFVLQLPDESWFDVNLMQKDMLLALEMGRRLDVPLPTTAVTNEFLTAARGMGLAKYDFAVVFKVLARMAGRRESLVLLPVSFRNFWFSWQMNSIISEPSATICCSTLTVNGRRVRFRIVDRDVDLQLAEVHAPEPLGQRQGVGKRIALPVEPSVARHIGQRAAKVVRRDHERVAIPSADRVAVPVRLRLALPAAGADRRCKSCESRSSTRT